MEIVKAIILGIVQGLTEFLPVSSSGHLVIGSQLLNFSEQGVVFSVCLHLGTLFSVMIVFRKDIQAMCMAPLLEFKGTGDKESRTYFLWDIYVVLATLPAVVVGLFLKDSIELLYSSTFITYCMLLVTGAIMSTARFIPERDEPITWYRAILVGCAQALAIFPGLSRSGSTIFVGMLLGVDLEKIVRFSFIMSIPAILGAAVLQFGDLAATPMSTDHVLGLVFGTIAAAISGYLAIKLLIVVIRKNSLHWFGYYCIILAVLGLCFHFNVFG